MDILYVATAYPPAVGGAQIHAHCLAKAVRAQGNTVHTVSHWSSNRTDWIRGATVLAGPPTSYEHEGIAVRQLGYSMATRLAMIPCALAYPLLVSPGTRALAGLMRPYFESAAGAPDVVHATRIGREFIVRAALDFARRRGLPFVLTPNHHPRWHGRLYTEYDRIYREADAIIALTEEEKKMLVEQKGVDDARIHVRGIGPVLADSYSAETFRRQHGLEDLPVVLYLGQQYRYKGPGALLDATPEVWKKHPETRFVFIGPHTDYSKKRFAAVDDKRILNLGAVDLETKTSALAACDLMCLPSLQESFGGVYVEAWAMGKPVIGGRIGPIACVIDEGENGLLSTQEPSELAAALLRLLDDPEKRAAMGEAGHRKVTERYAWAHIAQQNVELYRQLAAEQRRRPNTEGE